MEKMQSNKRTVADFIEKSANLCQSCSSSNNKENFEENNEYKKLPNPASDYDISDPKVIYKNRSHFEIHLHDCENIKIGNEPCDITTKEIINFKNERWYLDCQAKLKLYYKSNHAFMRSFFWKEKGFDYSIKDYFVELKVDKGNLRGNWKIGQNIELYNIFSHKDDLQRFLFTADPGYGKTTLCKKLAYDWSDSESSNYLKHFDFVIVIPLGKLKENINDFIINFICENSNKEIIKKLKKYRLNLNFLIMLDGYDEMNDKDPVLKFIDNEYSCISSKMTIIITSRPYFIQDILEKMEERFSINGLGKENQKKYITSMFENENEIQSLLQRMDQNKFLYDLAQCPLMLHMLCCLQHDKVLCEVNRTTDLYIKIFSLIINRYSQKYNYVFKEGKHVLGENILMKLGELAWNYLQDNEKITSENLKKYFPNNEEEKIIVGLDILVSLPCTIKGREIIIYDPLHQTFFEFLSSLYLTTLEKLPKKSRFSDIIYIFLCGLFGEKPLPSFYNVSRQFDNRTYNTLFLKKIFIETKENEHAFNKFCSPIRSMEFNVISDDIDILVKVLNCQKLKMLTLFLPRSWDEYNSSRDKLIESKLNDREFSLHIYAGFEKSTHPYIDMRESISTVLYLTAYLECKNLKIFLSGSHCIDVPSLNFKYNKITYLSPIPNEIKTQFNFNKTEAIALGGDYKPTFLISCEQYKILFEDNLLISIINCKSLDNLRK